MPETIKLKPAGALSGRVIADGAPARHLAAIKIISRAPFQGQPLPDINISGRADVAPDAQGRFEIRALAEGPLMFLTTPADGSTLRSRPPAAMTKQVKAGERTAVEIPLVRGVRASGVVRERGSKRPIPGVKVAVLYGYNDQDSAVTDDEGRFACLTAPGEIMVLPGVPAEYAPLARESMASLRADIPGDAIEFEFPPIELTSLAATRGIVVVEDGRPASGAKVRARWFSLEQATGQSSLKDVSLSADEKGEFTLASADPEKELVVEARSPAGFGRARLKLKDLEGREIKLKLEPAGLVALSGRAIDTAGKPLAGATIEIWTMPQPLIENQAIVAEHVKFDGEAEIRADDDGNFQTPQELDRQSS
ncbi:MAG TPA: hypothetical protein VFU81_19480, partial [Thermomicrobiales bacterium]|nr:hypothetical protein [Thermomicrobiales bacterium]